MPNYLGHEAEHLREKTWTIRTSRLISAFYNPIDEQKVNEFRQVFAEWGQLHNFPVLLGYPGVIKAEQIGSYFLSGEEILNEHLGEACWHVTEGHHRSTAAILEEVPYFDCQLDYNFLGTQTANTW